MMGSSRLLQILKILSVFGFVVNAFAAVVALIFLLIFSDAMGTMEFWAVIWGSFSVGMPMFGILYAALKMREYLRDIHAELKKSGG